MSLKDARLARDAARLRVKGDRNTSGVDIVAEKRAGRQEEKIIAIAAKAPAFEQCAQQYIDENWSKWSKKHRAVALLAQDLRLPDHWQAHGSGDQAQPQTANRVRGRIETIIAKNVDVDEKDFRNPAELTKQLREKLPKRPKRVVRHHPALPYAEVSSFMIKLAKHALA